MTNQVEGSLLSVTPPKKEEKSTLPAGMAPVVEQPVAPPVEPKTMLDVTLDRHRPFGTCHGHDDDWPSQPKFYQDGLYFTADGSVIPGKGDWDKKLAYENRPRKKVVMEVEVDEDGDPIVPRKKKPQVQKAIGADGPPTGMDVFAWARGEAMVPFGDVRKEIRKLYGKDIRSAHEARDYLLDGKFMQDQKA
jgi:hypothetical protein